MSRRSGAAPVRALDAPGVRAAIAGVLAASIDVALSNDAAGCLLILGMIHGASTAQGPRECLRIARRRTVDLLHARLQRGIEEGELAPDTDPARLAAFYHGITQAISFQARGGASRAELEALVEPALAALTPA